MAELDPISQNGKYTITNLKNATGIADDRLSSHAPSGPGVETSFSDFVCKGLGRVDGTDGDGSLNYSRLLGVSEVANELTNYTDGTYNANDNWEFDQSSMEIVEGENFWIRIILSDDELGAFFAEQILKNGSGLEFVDAETSSEVSFLGNYKIDLNPQTSTGRPFIDLQFSLDEYTSRIIVALTFEDGLNVNADSYGTSSFFNGTHGLALQTRETKQAFPVIDTWVVYVTYTSSGDYEFDFHPNNDNDPLQAVNDPAGGIGTYKFEVYDTDPETGTPYEVQNDDPRFMASQNLEQVVNETKFSDIEGGREKDFWVNLIDGANGNQQDCVYVKVAEDNVDNWPSTAGNTEKYLFTTSTTRSQASIVNPYAMNISNL